MTDNSKRHKIISLTLLFYCAFVIFLGDFIPIEFVSSTFKNIYFSIIYISFPVFLIWTIINVSKIKRPAIFVTVATILSVTILLVVGFAHTMCGTTTEIIFQNKNNSQTIVRRNYGCGAWDSDFPVYTYHKVVPMTPFFNIVTKYDITNIDKDVWTEKNSNQSPVDYYEKAALTKAAAHKAAAGKIKDK